VSLGEAESAKGFREDSDMDLIVPDLYPNGFDAWDVLQDIRGKGHHLTVLIRITTLDKPQ